MRCSLACLTSCLLLPACGPETAAETSTTDETSSTAATTGTTTTGTPTTTAPTTTDATTTSPTTTDGSSSTGAGGPGCAQEGGSFDAMLVHGDEPPGCGPLEFTGRVTGANEGPTWNLDSCPCEAACRSPDPWTFTLTVPSNYYLPYTIPDCPRIVVERQLGAAGCELVGVAFWDLEFEPERPLYIAGSLLGPLAAVADLIGVSAEVVESCDCSDCCDPSERYDLTFTHDDESVTVPESSFGEFSPGPTGFFYTIEVLQAHQTGECGTSPAIDWLLRWTIAL